MKKVWNEENGIRGIDIAVVPECNLIEDREKLLPADVQRRRVVDTSCYQDYNSQAPSSSWLRVPITLMLAPFRRASWKRLAKLPRKIDA